MVEQLRTHFDSFYESAQKLPEEFVIQPPQLPRKRSIPKRFYPDCEPTEFSTPKDYFRKHYCELVDKAAHAVRQRFEQPGMNFALEMESLLVRAANKENIKCGDKGFTNAVEFYTEMDKDRFLRQLAFLPVRHHFCKYFTSVKSVNL